MLKIKTGCQIILCVFILMVCQTKQVRAQCEIEITSVDSYCLNGQTFIDFEIDSLLNTTNYDDFFIVSYAGNVNSVFNFGSINYTINVPNNAGQIAGLYVYIYGENCFDEIDVELPDCASTCSITSFSATAYCNNDDLLNITYSFDILNGNNSGYDLFIDGVFYDYFPNYPSGVVTIENYVQTQFNDPIEITISDNDNPNCSVTTTASFSGIDCSSDDCITNVTATLGDCIPNGTVNVEVDFDYINVQHSWFSLTCNGELSFHDWTDLPVTCNLPADEGTYELLIMDGNEPACSATTDVTTPFCVNLPCSISNVEITTTPCDGDLVGILIDFDFENNPSDYFLTSIVGLGGSYQYSDLPVQWWTVPGDGETTYDFTISDVIDSNCTAEASVTVPDCGAQPCNVEVSNIEVGCNGYIPYVYYDIDAGNDAAISYNLYANGSLLGTFNYGPGSGFNHNLYNMSGTVLLQWQGSINCFYETTIEIPPACADYCNFQISAIESYCDGTTQFVDFEIETSNVGSNGFEAFYDNQSLGIYPYGEINYTIEIPTNLYSDQMYLFDIDSTDCTASYDLPIVDCGTDCQFVDLSVETICDDYTGTFSYEINFDSQNEGANGFTIAGNGNSYGPFSYADLPISFGELTGDGLFTLELILSDIDNPDCQIVWEGDPIECTSGGQCFISDIFIGNECSYDDELFVELNFIPQNTLNNGFEVWINSVFFSNYQYTDLPIELGPLVGDGLTSYLIEFADVDDPNCGATIELDEISCVWAGDGNFDKIVNNYDLLNIGLAYGFSGEQRPNADIDFDAESATSWNGSFANGINHKHADCNGNGEVTALDIEAIDLNYNQIHGKTASTNNGLLTDPPIYADLPDGTLIGGSELEIPIVLGSIDFPIDSIYGVAFTIEYNSSIIDSTSVSLNFGDSWFAPESLQINIAKESETGFIDAAISRIDHQNTNGSGEIGVMTLVLLENIEGKTSIPLEIAITKIKAITHSEYEFTLNNSAESVEVISSSATINVSKYFNIYPNPADDYILLSTNDNIKMNVSIYNASGELINIDDLFQNKRIDIFDYPKGVYLIKLENQESIHFEKLIKR